MIVWYSIIDIIHSLTFVFTEQYWLQNYPLSVRLLSIQFLFKLELIYINTTVTYITISVMIAYNMVTNMYLLLY